MFLDNNGPDLVLDKNGNKVYNILKSMQRFS